MGKTLKEIVENSTDLYEISVLKKNNHDRSTWEFVMKDPRWTDDSFKDYTFKTVHLRRGDGFFLAAFRRFSYALTCFRRMFSVKFQIFSVFCPTFVQNA